MCMMICLIRPPAVEWIRFTTVSLTLPLGLAYIAGALESSGRQVRVIDSVGEGPDHVTRYYKGHLIGIPLERIVAQVPADPDWIGITVIFTHEWPAVVRLVDLIKVAHPDVPVVLGGEHITSMPEFCLLTSRADVLVLGEGEETVVELAAAFESGRPLAETDGLAFRERGRIVVNKRRRRKRDIDSIAWPAWHHFRLKTYHAHGFTGGGVHTGSLTIPILATRGCPYQCTYCSAPNMWAPQWIPRDPARVADEIQHYVEKYGAGNFPFQDLTAIIQKKWIMAFCTELLRRGLNISWQLPTGTRSEAVDAEVAEMLRRSGMVTLAYAPESASETTRRYIKKKMTSDHLMASIDAAAGAKLSVTLFIVIGFPHDTQQLILENLPFLDHLATRGVTDVSVSFYIALPGTELFHSLYDAGRIRLDRRYFVHIAHSLTLWPSSSYCDNLTLSQLALLKFRIYLQFYLAKLRSLARTGLLASCRALFSSRCHPKEPRSRMLSALRNILATTWDSVRVLFSRRWLTPQEEDAMFENWDTIYRQVRAMKAADGTSPVAPLDTTRLHLSNVIIRLKKDHGASRVLLPPGPKPVNSRPR
jgi:radical SAM superfamily enzyme YgiQ (UPF0313 family)